MIMRSIELFTSLLHAPVRNIARHAAMVALLVALQLLVAGCIPDPTGPGSGGPGKDVASGVIVINEGLWRQDNATLTLYDPVTETAQQDFFALKNPGLRLGDVANSVTIWKGRAYIPVSTSQGVEVLELSTGRSLGRVLLPLGNQPRYVAIIDSSTAFVTSLEDSVIEFDPIALRPVRSIPVGPAAEGIAYAHGRLFVANSGYGHFRRNEPKAGTLSVIDPESGVETALIPIGSNPRHVRYLPSRDRIYILHGLPDSLGGVVELDPATGGVTGRWPVMSALDMVFDEDAGKGYASGDDGIVRFDLGSQAAPVVVIPGSSWPGLVFYSIGFDPKSGRLYVGSISSYTLSGEVLIFESGGVLTGRFPCGINPGDFGFY